MTKPINLSESEQRRIETQQRWANNAAKRKAEYLEQLKHIPTLVAQAKADKESAKAAQPSVEHSQQVEVGNLTGWHDEQTLEECYASKWSNRETRGGGWH